MCRYMCVSAPVLYASVLDVLPFLSVQSHTLSLCLDAKVVINIILYHVQVAALRESKKELEECLGRASAAQAMQAAEIKKLSQELQQVGRNDT